jgi:hypothetical protein
MNASERFASAEKLWRPVMKKAIRLPQCLQALEKMLGKA